MEKKRKWFTRNSKDVSNKMVQIGKLGASPPPPIKWLACIKILLPKLEVIFEFIKDLPVVLFVSGSEVNLLRWSMLHDQCSSWRVFVSAGCEARVVVMIEGAQYWYCFLEVSEKVNILCIIFFQIFIWNARVQHFGQRSILKQRWKGGITHRQPKCKMGRDQNGSNTCSASGAQQGGHP